jgi:hypothetical protein
MGKKRILATKMVARGNADTDNEGMVLRGKRTRRAPLGDITNAPPVPPAPPLMIDGPISPPPSDLTSAPPAPSPIIDAAVSPPPPSSLSPPSTPRTEIRTRSNQPPHVPTELEDHLESQDDPLVEPLDDPLQQLHISQLAAAPLVSSVAAFPPHDLEAEIPINFTSHLHLLELEHQLPSEDIVQFLPFSTDRRRLLNTITKVHRYFHLKFHTLFVAMSILDRYLSLFDRPSDQFASNDLKLIGLSALFLAAKIVERRFSSALTRFTLGYRDYGRTEPHPSGSRSGDRVGGVLYVNPLIMIEAKICEALQFFLDPPTITSFLSPYLLLMRRSQYTSTSPTSITMGVQVLYYLAERVLADHSMLFFLPSLIAATLVRLVRRSLASMVEGDGDGMVVWPEEYRALSGYYEDDLRECEGTIENWLANQAMDSELMKKYQGWPDITSYPLAFQPRSFPLRQGSQEEQE